MTQPAGCFVIIDTMSPPDKSSWMRVFDQNGELVGDEAPCHGDTTLIRRSSWTGQHWTSGHSPVFPAGYITGDVSKYVMRIWGVVDGGSGGPSPASRASSWDVPHSPYGTGWGPRVLSSIAVGEV